MKPALSDQERNRLDKRIVETEKRTNTQIVLSVIKRSDTYTELPWIAFALGASLAGLLIFILNLLFDDWVPPITLPTAVASILAFGAVFALLTVLIPGFAKWFLAAHRTEVEVQQYAESLFATSKRTGLLLLVSLFERKVVLLPDKGLHSQLTEAAMQSVIAAMTPFLKRKKLCQAFEAGLERLSDIVGTSVPGTGENELPNEIIEEKGV
jgi:putative membrane protein